MFDTMTMTKITAAVCASLLFYLVGSWGAETLYHTGEKAHKGEEVAQAYTIDTGEAEPAEAAEAAPDFAVVLASADAAAGEKVFGKCKACHKLDGSDGTGPHLNGIVGKAKAASAGFAYSEGLLAMAADAWTPDNLNAFLISPKAYVAGTKMAFAGLPKIYDRANLVAYLATVQ